MYKKIKYQKIVAFVPLISFLYIGYCAYMNYIFTKDNPVYKSCRYFHGLIMAAFFGIGIAMYFLLTLIGEIPVIHDLPQNWLGFFKSWVTTTAVSFSFIFLQEHYLAQHR